MGDPSQGGGVPMGGGCWVGEGLGALLLLQINKEGGERAFQPPEGRRNNIF